MLAERLKSQLQLDSEVCGPEFQSGRIGIPPHPPVASVAIDPYGCGCSHFCTCRCTSSYVSAFRGS